MKILFDIVLSDKVHYFILRNLYYNKFFLFFCLEGNRVRFSKDSLFKDIIIDIQSDDSKLALQAIRCLCNICAENG